MKIGYQGDIFSNCEYATKCFIKKNSFFDVEEIPLITSKRVGEELLNGGIDYGVAALENNTGGVVEETKIYLKNNFILADVLLLPVNHCMFINSNIENISKVVSHIQALRQTRQTRHNLGYLWKEEVIEDTALAAKLLSCGELDNCAVICRKEAGLYYGLRLIEEDLEDTENNFTLFGLFRG